MKNILTLIAIVVIAFPVLSQNSTTGKTDEGLANKKNVVIIPFESKMYISDIDRDLVEKKHGLAAKDFLVKEMEEADDVILATNKDAEGKFGRILGTLIGVHSNELDGSMRVNINEKMVDFHHAVAYHGQSKDDIEEEHLKNRTLLNLD